MMNYYFILAGLLVFALLIRLFRQPASNPVRSSFLDGAQCVLNEQEIRTTTPVPLHGKPDQVFKLRDGRYLLLDTKTRSQAKVFFSDIVQLSVYAVILKNNGFPVCPFAVVRIASKKPRYLQVDLKPEHVVVKLYHKYHAIKSGSLTPSCTCGKH